MKPTVPAFISIKGVAAMGNVSVSTAGRYSGQSDFPEPRYFSPGKKVWISEEVRNWFLDRPRSRR
ncbi:hypothetical protein E2493_14945 [Sphingomonas parva]|uniref:AlpA family phage regulatory protein n=1 Tax=Sphingomonas parva TaxID=2555898 RepID=A0A4Y8ZNB4_9SPHN|nr:hypothetical protein [Sphingomonas parva]TFI57500.1 hypothetical protein E2493_14945 [Sphingomonas parva]